MDMTTLKSVFATALQLVYIYKLYAQSSKLWVMKLLIEQIMGKKIILNGPLSTPQDSVADASLTNE